MLKFSNEEFEKVKSNGESFYKSIGEIYCPYFKEKIAFNAQGLEHLKYKYRGKKIFWSIIPFWGMNRETMTRIFHDGNAEED